jgi:hypothetical protein
VRAPSAPPTHCDVGRPGIVRPKNPRGARVDISIRTSYPQATRERDCPLGLWAARGWACPGLWPPAGAESGTKLRWQWLRLMGLGLGLLEVAGACPILECTRWPSTAFISEVRGAVFRNKKQ